CSLTVSPPTLSYPISLHDALPIYVIASIAGISLGSSQSTSRSLMSLLTPKEKKTEFFGFYSFFGKASAILGPFVFGIISSVIDQDRKSTRLNSSHVKISYAVFCLK